MRRCLQQMLIGVTEHPREQRRRGSSVEKKNGNWRRVQATNLHDIGNVAIL